ncbi:4Fe-4S binding protein [Pelagicoccus mobilis]|uniref:4Fe-4S binding protein n=1 Tax=Pelagicoccus mobilis TaxID=415221 RepID=A0A934VTV2_9BACT|nr:4Fe-4S binding protein [Pelagicoccus mobilis]MBK1879889.1 4Fe-4S binding protein [Pelagicoccus mobilis]
MGGSPQTFTRRDFFSNFLKHVREDARSESPTIVEVRGEAEEQVAVIQGRYCLAYQNSFCSVCSERCPESGAIEVRKGIPTVDADHCTGCGICRDLCPAPTNAILMI